MAYAKDELWKQYRPTGNIDYTFKVLMIGESGVGKTSIVSRYTKDSFEAIARPSVGIDLEVKSLKKRGKQIQLQIWDTAGQEKYRSVAVGFYRGGMGFMIVYDVTNKESFLKVRDWLTQIRMYALESARVVLVGNKTDLNDDRVIPKPMGRQLANQLGLEFFETSATYDGNITAAFALLVDLIYDKMEEHSKDEYSFDEAKNNNIYTVNAADEVSDKCAC